MYFWHLAPKIHNKTLQTLPCLTSDLNSYPKEQLMIKKVRLWANRNLSRETRRKLSRLMVWPPVGWVPFGGLRRTRPFTPDFGSGRGLAIDRYYIEKFLAENAQFIRGHVLEIKHNHYTVKFGRDRVTKSDVLHPVEGNPDATIIADLTKADHLPSNTFDTIIFTQTLQVIYNINATVATLYRILKPGGTILMTGSGISQISVPDFERWGEYWRFTTLSARRIFEEAFPKDCIEVRSYGNVLAAISFLQGLSTEDLKKKELDVEDLNYQMLIAVRAVKPENAR
jgi:SAM-dependent methyltransferase